MVLAAIMARPRPRRRTNTTASRGRNGHPMQSLLRDRISPLVPDIFEDRLRCHETAHVHVQCDRPRLRVDDDHRALPRQRPCKGIHTIAGLEALKGPRAQGGGVMPQRDGPAVECQEVVVPLARVLPGKGGAAERVLGGAHADLVAVIDTGCARHGHLAEHAQAQGALILPHEPERPGGIVAVEQIQLGVVHLPIVPRIELVDLAGERLGRQRALTGSCPAERPGPTSAPRRSPTRRD